MREESSDTRRSVYDWSVCRDDLCSANSFLIVVERRDTYTVQLVINLKDKELNCDMWYRWSVLSTVQY